MITCPNAVTDEKVQTALPQLDRLVENAMGEKRIPGLAVGIVYQGQVVYLKGFGVRQAGKPELVDPDTVFQLASVSKPLSSTIISSLVTEGTVKWDDPVVKYDPEFQLYDPAVSAKVTIGDMFAHRSGLPGQAGNDLEAVGFERDEIMERLHFLPPAYPFRKGYGYSNFGLTEGAVAAAKAAGERWAVLARRQLFEPLGMAETSMRYTDFVARANRAHLHVLVNNQWTPALTRDADAQAPAGGASSSVRDLAQWLLLELADGQYGGQQLISKEALNIARTPQASSGSNPDTGLSSYYGFGWALDYLADGVFRMSHSGAFTMGGGTNVSLLPSQDLGVIVLGNAFPTGVPEAVADSLLDLARYGHQTRDDNSVYGVSEKILNGQRSAREVNDCSRSNFLENWGLMKTLSDGVKSRKIAYDSRQTAALKRVYQKTFELQLWQTLAPTKWQFKETCFDQSYPKEYGYQKLISRHCSPLDTNLIIVLPGQASSIFSQASAVPTATLDALFKGGYGVRTSDLFFGREGVPSLVEG